MKQDTFEDYLTERHAAQYIGLDDDMGDDFGEWVGSLDPQEIIDYGEAYGAKRFNDGQIKGLTDARKILAKT